MEHDLLGDRPVPDAAYYGVQTLRAKENFHVTGTTPKQYPDIIYGFAMVKKGTFEFLDNFLEGDKEVLTIGEMIYDMMLQ